ncbi:ABC transporter permease [Fulvivirga lutea]|uniref:ABC transporter permease n=1 Tax=Fulvivirga lutea TaxID=2810512 RepID=A0A974WP92_9BACT|nr:ABC transporter permease [Fulvivirga lutea]QSE99138.1 ABC transporter permease [Fulvivirga lutea]
MLKNYIKVALRGFSKNKSATIINIAGLSIGLACFIMIFVYVQVELSYDTFHNDYEKIYRVTTIDEALGVSSNNVGITNPIMTVEAKNNLSEITASTRMLNNGRTRMENGDDVTYAENAKYGESSFFELFNFPLIEGSDTARFNAPRKLIMTESLAQKTFKTDRAIGKLLRIDEEDWEVVGVMKDSEEKSHLELDLLMSIYPTQADSSLAQYLNGWAGLGMLGYIKINDPSNAESVERKMNELAHSNDVPDFWITKLQPLADAHLKSSGILFDGNNANKGDIVYVYSLSAIALFVILIAAFNFMNLATAKSSTRAKEVGVRKVMGAQKQSLVSQHLGESILLCFISLIIALVLCLLGSPYMNLGFEGNILLHLLSSPGLLITIVLITLAIGVLAGIYPAFVLSNFNSVNILRGKFQTSKSGILLRKILVVIQFVASVTLIIATLFITKQLEFIKNKNLGFSQDQVLTIQMNDPGLSQNMQAFRDKLVQYDQISAVSMSNNMPGRTFGRTGVTPEGVPEDEENWIVSALSFDENYLEVMGMEIVEGRNYSQEFGTDQQEAIIVNEAFVEQVGWDEAVGKKLTMGNDQERTIVGVVKNFHFASMRHAIEPLIMFYNPGPNGNISMRIKSDISETVSQVAGVWNEVYPDYPFEYQFFDEEFAQMFQADEEFSVLVMNFTWLAIFIACLGLFGLSAYMAEQRRKEIGIRKVLGSSVKQAVVLLSKEFVLLIVVANVIAFPLSYLAVKSWIGDFQYKIELLDGSALITFIAAGVIALAIGLFTVSYQSIAAALANPVKSLRSE